MTVYTRRELSEKIGIGFDTLRYYEKFGLLKIPARGLNKYRQYDDYTAERLIFIKQSKKCGFTLNEIKKTLDLLENSESCDTNSDDIIDSKMQAIDEKINELIMMKDMLKVVKEQLRGSDCKQIMSLSLELEEQLVNPAPSQISDEIT